MVSLVNSVTTQSFGTHPLLSGYKRFLFWFYLKVLCSLQHRKGSLFSGVVTDGMAQDRLVLH